MGRFLQVLGNSYLVNLLYGCRHAPHIGSFGLPYVYVKAMLFAASADTLSPPERKYISGLVELLLTGSATPQLLEARHEVLQFIDAVPRVTPEPEAVSSFLSGSVMTSPVLSRILLYDAVRAASADGDYTAEERTHVSRVSRQLGIPDAVKRRIEDIVEREVALAARKVGLLTGDGSRFLAAASAAAERRRAVM